MRTLQILLALSVTSCASAKLERYGDAAVRIERSTQGVVDGVHATKETIKADCVLQAQAGKLTTEAERMKCVEKALQLIDVTTVAVQAVKAALVSFWTLYPVLEARIQGGEKLGAADWAKLMSKADAVVAAYQDLVKYAKEMK